MKKGRFVVGLLASVPEASELVAEHLDDEDGTVWLHLLLADLRRFLLDAWKRQDDDLLRRGLGLLDAALTTGDEYVENAVSVSFVEDIGWWEPDVQPFIATWPVRLAAEVERLRNRSEYAPFSAAGGALPALSEEALEAVEDAFEARQVERVVGPKELLDRRALDVPGPVLQVALSIAVKDQGALLVTALDSYADRERGCGRS